MAMIVRMLAVGAVIALAACQNQSEPAAPTTEVRELSTAPADLQLICASKAAEQFEAPADQSLPTASATLPGGQYQVELTVAGEAATCVIDDNATIISLAKTAPQAT